MLSPCDPAGEKLVTVRTLLGVLVFFSVLRSCEGKVKRMSLLPAWRFEEPSHREPIVALSVPEPPEKTTKRSRRVFDDTRMSSGAYMVRSGAGSELGTFTTGPTTFTGVGASLAAEGFDLSTVSVPVSVNSRPSSAGAAESLVSFGSDTYACGLPAQVFQGTVSVAVDPETANAC